tara:strand:- start:1056 stop:1427 length:372 start_codon:yes stop_codon:yes gene_type:complete
MSENIINVMLTEEEVEILMGLLHDRASELMEQHSVNGLGEVADRAAQLLDLETDLREQLFRGDWRNDAVPDLAMQMVQTGINAREQAKESSRAAQRREERLIKLMEGTASPCDADFMNDPLNW